MNGEPRYDEPTDKLEVRSYLVRRWTGFEWSYPEPPEDMGKKKVREMRDEIRKDREDHMERSAGIVGRKLREIRPKFNPVVKVVRIDREPQLLFELTVPGISEDDARKRAMYAIGRGLSAKIPTGGHRQVFSRYMNRGKPGVTTVPNRVTLNPPWGKCEVDEVKDQPRPKLRAVVGG